MCMHFWLRIAAVIAFLIPGVARSGEHLPPPSPEFQSGLRILRGEEQRTQVISTFATKAGAGDTDAILAMFVPAARASEGDSKIRKYISEKIIPFFSGFDKLSNYKTIEPRTMPDERTGYRYYTYSLNANGERKPFDIIVMEDNGGLFIANFNARGCIKGKHPICDQPAQLPEQGPKAAESDEFNTKKLAALDAFDAFCGQLNPEVSRIVTEKFMKVFFPEGPPKNIQEIRQSEEYKMFYDQGYAALVKDKTKLTPEKCLQR